MEVSIFAYENFAMKANVKKTEIVMPIILYQP